MAVERGPLSINSENMFPIIKKWLYSDHDIFYRELVSNGCDAITKLKKLDMMGDYELPEGFRPRIDIEVDPQEKTIKVTDNGLGMTADEVKEYILGMMETLVENIIQSVTVGTKFPEEWDFTSLNEKLKSITFNWPEMAYNEDKMRSWTPDDLQQAVLRTMRDLYSIKEKEIGEETMRELEKMVMLRVIDNRWMDHIDAMDDLKKGIGLRSLGQMDPAVAYANEGFDMFEELEADIQEETVRFCYNVTQKTTTARKSVVSQEEERKDEYRDDTAERQASRQSSPNMPKAAPKPEDAKRPETFRRETPKVGRNELCPCGSGKKYKNCHGRMQ